MGKALSYMRFVMVIYMAFHFISNAAFVHNHIIDGESISHAHPFTGNQHTASDASQIQHFNITPCINVHEVEIPECQETAATPVSAKYIASCTIQTFNTLLLRGPPVLF